MLWPEARARLFPSPHRAEPENLRRDIIDELADHLALAAEDEVVKHGRTHEGAWQRAIERFGNPDAVARKLWWDAMKERVMRDWIQTGLAVASAAVIVLMGLFVVRTQVKMMEVLEGLKAPAPAAVPAGETLEVQVRRGSDTGPVAKGVRVQLSGQITGEATASVELETNEQGVVLFSPVPQGAYRLSFDDPQSTLHTEFPHSLFAGVGSKLTVVAPDFGTVEKRFETDPPLPFAGDQLVAVAALQFRKNVAGHTWRQSAYIAVGTQGVYEIVDGASFTPSSLANASRDVTGPSETLSLPRAPLELRNIGIARKNSDNRITFLDFNAVQRKLHSKETKRTYDEDVQVVAVELEANSVPEADRRVKNDLFFSRWIGEEWRGVFNPDEIWLDSYLIKAIPLTQAASVVMDQTAEGKATLTVKAVAPEQWAEDTPRLPGISRDATYQRVGNAELPALLQLPDLKALNNQFPSDYRFLLNICWGESGELFFWRTDSASPEPGVQFDVTLEKIETTLNDDSYPRQSQFDITGLIRANTDAPAAGLLVKLNEAPEETATQVVLPHPSRPRQEGEEGVVVSVDPDTRVAGTKRELPYVLVVSDTPPADL